MAGAGKKKTTMAKLNRESKLREKRLDKQARKEARKLAASQPEEEAVDTYDAETGEPREADETAQPDDEREPASSSALG
ncbi:MAG: hypothetical protein QOG15_987 [Solirubrobacteraceae bacterium]|jgi:hypothetical protein|nr:hypothetical protein [Solirubrobacteraceae bacterium]